MSKRNENLDDQIATLEAEIDHLQKQWKPYAKVQPGIPGMQTGVGPYNPSLFLAKSEIAIELDRKQIELAQLNRQRAEQTFADYQASRDLANAEAAYDAAGVDLAAAKATYEAVQTRYRTTQYALENQKERHAGITKTIARYEADERRWTKELERDQQLEANVLQGVGGPGIPAGPIGGQWRTIVSAKGP